MVNLFSSSVDDAKVDFSTLGIRIESFRKICIDSLDIPYVELTGKNRVSERADQGFWLIAIGDFSDIPIFLPHDMAKIRMFLQAVQTGFICVENSDILLFAVCDACMKKKLKSFLQNAHQITYTDDVTVIE